MSLLAPWNAVAAAAIAAPLLLLLYFLKLRRRRLRVSSTMLWERAVDDLHVNEPFRWLRSSWLLVLQMLALVLLALALGRPTIPGSGLLDDRVLLVIDASASMRAADSPTDDTRLAEAKRRAIEIVDGLSRDSAVQVVSFATEPESLTAMSTDHALAKAAIRGIEPTDEPGNLGDALRLASALMTTGDESQSTPARLVLVTDGGPSADTDADPIAGDPLLVRVGPEPGSALDNAGIVAATARRDYADPARLGVFLRLQSTDAQPRAVSLVVELDGEVAQRTPVTIPAAGPEGPGSRAVTINLTPGAARVLRVRISGEDALASDDQVVIVLPEASASRVLLATPGDSVSWVVGDVLAAIDGIEVRRVGEPGLTELLAEPDGLVAIDLAVLDRVGEPSSLPVPTLSFALALAGAPRESDERVSTDRFVTWDRGSAPMRDLSLDGVSIAEPAWFGGTLPESDTLARGRAGPIIVSTIEGRTRRIGVAFAPAESTWPVEISFPLFVAQAVESLRADHGGAAETIRTGESPRLQLASGLEPVLVGPERLRGRPLDDGASLDRTLTQFEPVSLVGEYATADGRPAIGVNVLSAGESSIAVSNEVRIGARSVEAGGGTAGRQEIWPWLVVAATVALTAEWLLFVVRARV